MQLNRKESNIVKSWQCLNKLMTYAKEHFLVFRYLHGGVTQYLSIKKFSHTRWIGLILQAEKLVKVEKDVRERANQIVSLKSIVDGID